MNFHIDGTLSPAAANYSSNGMSVATHQTSLYGSVYASNLFSTTDAAPGTGNAFAFFEDLALRALPTVTPCPADITGDRQVDGMDLATVLGSWGGPGGDLDGNGVTDGADLSKVLSDWGACP